MHTGRQLSRTVGRATPLATPPCNSSLPLIRPAVHGVSQQARPVGCRDAASHVGACACALIAARAEVADDPGGGRGPAQGPVARCIQVNDVEGDPGLDCDGARVGELVVPGRAALGHPPGARRRGRAAGGARHGESTRTAQTRSWQQLLGRNSCEHRPPKTHRSHCRLQAHPHRVGRHSEAAAAGRRRRLPPGYRPWPPWPDAALTYAILT